MDSSKRQSYYRDLDESTEAEIRFGLLESLFNWIVGLFIIGFSVICVSIFAREVFTFMKAADYSEPLMNPARIFAGCANLGLIFLSFVTFLFVWRPVKLVMPKDPGKHDRAPIALFFTGIVLLSSIGIGGFLLSAGYVESSTMLLVLGGAWAAVALWAFMRILRRESSMLRFGLTRSRKESSGGTFIMWVFMAGALFLFQMLKVTENVEDSEHIFLTILWHIAAPVAIAVIGLFFAIVLFLAGDSSLRRVAFFTMLATYAIIATILTIGFVESITAV